jgi:hypothetical protein
MRGSETGCTAPACHEDWAIALPGGERLCDRHHKARCDAGEAVWEARHQSYVQQRALLAADLADLDCVLYAAPCRVRFAEEEML